MMVAAALAVASFASARAEAEPAVTAVRASGVVNIDGLLDEEHWSRALPAGGFVQREPDEGQPATESTSFQVAYDDRAVYVAVHAHDREPGRIRGFLTRRDLESPSDWIHVAVSGQGDGRTAHEFAVNPVGVKLDAKWSDDSDRAATWDGVWDVAVRRVPDGWVAEFELPLGELRFTGDTEAWRIQVWRVVARHNETSFWRSVPRSGHAFVSRMGRLDGMAPRAHRPLVVRQYGVARTSTGDGGGESDARAGVDVRYGLTSSFVLNMSVYPDFGQVEGDPAELNLSTYETFLEERRELFVEGADQFKLTIGPYSEDRLFYSRRVGRDTEIVGAAKLSGRLGNGPSLGLLHATTAPAYATVTDAEGTREELATPMTNYSVVSVHSDLGGGSSWIRGMGGAVYRHPDAAAAAVLPHTAVSGGLDVYHSWQEHEYRLQLSLVGSYVTGTAESMALVQRSPVRYFQRPSLRPRLDDGRTRLAGVGSELTLGKVGGEPWLFEVYMNIRTPGLELNELGYLQAADRMAAGFFIGWVDTEAGEVFQSRRVELEVAGSSTLEHEATDEQLFLFAEGQLTSYWTLSGRYKREGEVVDTTLLRGGPALLVPARRELTGSVASDEREPIQLQGTVRSTTDTEGGRRLYLAPSLTVRPSHRWKLTLGLSYEESLEGHQYVDTRMSEAGSEYLVGTLARHTWSGELRADVTLSPRLTIQAFAQPYVSVGRYGGFQSVVDPTAAVYADRFMPTRYEGSADFNVRDLRSNLMLTWEYRPGSTVYLVWQQSRASDDALATGGTLGEQAGMLGDTPAYHVFLVKVTGLFSL